MIGKGAESLIITIIFLVFTSSVIAQITDNRKSEEDLKIEDQFIAAKLLVTTGKKADAIRLLDSLRRVVPPNAAIFMDLAKLHHSNKDINQTESNLKAAVQLEPNNIWIRKWEVNFAKELGRMDDAVKTLNHLVTLQPKNSENYDHLAQIYSTTKDYSKALQAIELKEKNIGWSAANTIMKAEVQEASGKLNDCINTLKTLTVRYPQEKKYYRLIVNTLHANDKISESEPYLKKIIDIDPNDNDAKLGLLLINKGKGGRDDYFTSLIPLISNPEAPIDLKIKELIPHVQKHAMSGDSVLGNQLISICDKLVIAHPSDVKAHAIYADVLKNNGNYVAATRQYEKTLSINNKNYTVWEQLMFCQMFSENMEALSITATDAQDLFPNQAMSYYFSSLVLIEKKDLKKAESMLNEATMIAAGNPDLDARINTASGKIYLLQKDFNKAKTYGEEAMKLSNGKSIEAAELLGDISKAMGDVKNAAMYYQKSYDLGNRSKSFLNKLAVIRNN